MCVTRTKETECCSVYMWLQDWETECCSVSNGQPSSSLLIWVHILRQFFHAQETQNFSGKAHISWHHLHKKTTEHWVQVYEASICPYTKADSTLPNTKPTYIIRKMSAMSVTGLKNTSTNWKVEFEFYEEGKQCIISLRILKEHLLRSHQAPYSITPRTELVLCHFRQMPLLIITGPLSGKNT